MKKQKDSWVSSYAKAFYADAVANNTPRGSLGEKHTRRIAARYAIAGRAAYRAERIKKFLVVSGVIGLLVFVVANWR